MRFSLKKILVLIVVVALVFGAIGLINHNKTSMEAKAKSVEILTTFPVSTIKAKIDKIDDQLSMIGTVSPNKEVTIQTEVSGKVTQVFFDIGKHVNVGETLVKLDDEIKNANYISAEANYEKAKRDYERYEKLLASKSVTDAQFDGIKLAYKSAEAQYIITKRQLNDTKIIAPFAGIITSKNVELGAILSNNSLIANLVDISTVRVRLMMAEKDIFKLQLGEQIKLATDVYTNTDFTGKVISINSKGDEAHTYLVELQLTNNTQKPLRAGMFMRAYFNNQRKENALVIPRECLVGSIINPQVFVAENDKAILKKIAVGTISGTNMEVLSGLKEGESVINNGQINLKDGVSIKIVK